MVSLRSVAAWAALVGGFLWLAQGVVLIARGGVNPDPGIEAVTFTCGFVALVAAAGIASWVRSASKARPVRAALAVLAALSVPLVVFLGQAAAFALPGSHWLESDAIVLMIALAAISGGVSWLRRRHPSHAECHETVPALVPQEPGGEDTDDESRRNGDLGQHQW